MEMLRDFRDVLLVLNTLGLVLIGVVTWLRKPGEEAAAAARTLDRKLDDTNHEHRNRLTMIESQLKHMPTSDELSALEGDVKAINERTKWQADEIETIRATVTRIESYLLNAK